MASMRRGGFGAAGVLACLAALPAAAPPDNLIVERLGEERGFPSETITALFRDRAGFLWVGSREGLAVWDGYSVRIFEHEVGNPTSLPDNSIRTLYEDRTDHLWVGTNTGGLARLDRTTGRFQSFPHDPANPRSLSHASVYSMAEDRDGHLWVGTQEGLNRLDPQTLTFDRVLPGDYVYALKLDRRGRLWIATVGGGIAWMDPTTRRVTRIPFATEKDGPYQSPNMFAIAEDPAGTLWFGSERGLYKFDASANALRRVPLPELAAGKDVPILTSIAMDGQGTLWISTWNRGLVAYDPGSGRSRGFRHDPEQAE